MAPLSILPGRLRFETTDLVGQQDACLRIERRMSALQGVQSVTVNYRTGRILVKYDETIVDRQTLDGQIAEILASPFNGEDLAENNFVSPQKEKPSKGAFSSHMTRHLLVDVITHAILPAPFDLLLPSAVSALRK